MLGFSLHVLQLGDRHCMLLPKLNSAQVKTILKRLTDKDFQVEVSGGIVARKANVAIHLSPTGLCWSNVDPTDAIAPVIPGILRIPKETVRLEDLRNLYFTVDDSQGLRNVRLSTRVESGTSWEVLRVAGESGLTPDELTVITFFMSASSGGCRLLTDFPVEESKVRLLGKRQYYESYLDSDEIVGTLRSIERTTARNSYLPKNGILRLELVLPSPKEQVELFNELGEWCYLQPLRHKSSN